MKKVLWLIVCLMTMVNVFGQNQSLYNMKVLALRDVKRTLVAPTQFVLANEYGERISVGDLKIHQVEQYETNENIYFPCHYVVITGDAANLMGGHERIKEIRYIYKGNVYKSQPHTAKDWCKIYDAVDEMPSFPGGNSALMEYIQQNMKYPIVAQENEVQGRVVVSFVVEKDGSITNAKVVRSVDPSLDKEAMRIVSSMPRWVAGKQNGSCVRVKYNVPISFILQ